MKHTLKSVFFCFGLMIAILIQSCSSDTPKSTVDESGSKSDSKSNVAATTVGKGCCFNKQADYIPFFPAGNALLTIHGSEEITASFYCGEEDDPQKSNASRKYQIDKAGTTSNMVAKFISLKIMDYCSRPDDLATEIERRTTNSEKEAAKNAKVTFNRIEKQGLYKGYTWMDASSGNNASNVLLYAAVDGRFMIQIQGIDHTRMDALNQLFEMIPLDQLAAI